MAIDSRYAVAPRPPYSLPIRAVFHSIKARGAADSSIPPSALRRGDCNKVLFIPPCVL